ncbi:MAG: GntR family transcriptional regulator, partial [Armatimonadetes bacterium]|nr:GntR family transcriptional regulator [Candidatus Hippobium faecium]
MPKYEELKNKLKQIIKSAKPHDLLPSQRTLAKDYNVSSITVQRALSDLENEGLIYVKQGKGNFVAPKIAYFPEVHFICDSLRTTGYGDKDLFPTIIEDIDLCLRENNMETIISFYKSTYQLEIQLIESLPQKKPYGAILFYSGRQQPVDAYKKLCDCMQNVVFVDRKVEGINAHYVATDNFNTAYKMAQILTQEKFDKIYYFSMPDIHTNVDWDRYAGFDAFMRENDLDYDKYFIEKEVMGDE